MHGVRVTSDPARGSNGLAALLESHRYTSGFGFLAQGTPTNNTDTVRSPWVPESADERFSEIDAVPPLTGTTNAARLRRALGIDGAEWLDGVDGAADVEQDEQAAMNRLIWWAIVHPTLGELYSGKGGANPLLTSDGQAWLKDFFVGRVRGGGAVPVIRCDRQPYGVLPVTSGGWWEYAGERSTLRDVLGRLRPSWESASADVARLDPDRMDDLATAAGQEITTVADAELGQVESRALADGEVSLDLRAGAEARIADPLWMLARQRQVGEFKGEDAASPIEVRVATEAVSITSWRPGASGAWQAHTSSDPLESRVERTAVLDGPGRFGLAVEAGAHLLRLIDDAGLRSSREALRAAFPLTAPTIRAMETSSQRAWYALMQKRMPDGLAVRDAIAASGAAAVAAAIDPALEPVLTAFAAWAGDWVREPDGDTSWTEERLEHRLGIKAEATGIAVELDAPEYAGGRLDWWAFDLAAETVSPAPAVEVTEKVLLPTPLRYAGMPASRWWEMEQGHVHFGDLDAGSADLARLIVAESATVGGDDWYIVPVTARYGQLVRVRSLVVRDTFGGEHVIEAAAVQDGPERPYRFFELRGHDTGVPWLLLAPVVAGTEEGEPLEEVHLWRDEDANLAWAAELRVEGPAAVLDRRAWWQANRPLPPAPPSEGVWAYRLESQVAPHWIPLVPVDAAVDPDGVLKRGRMSAWTRMDPAWEPGVLGELLAGRSRRIEDQEVPVEGVTLTRRWQVARSPDGAVHLWVGRQKRAGRGRFAANLVYDCIEQG